MEYLHLDTALIKLRALVPQRIIVNVEAAVSDFGSRGGLQPLHYSVSLIAGGNTTIEGKDVTRFESPSLDEAVNRAAMWWTTKGALQP